VLTTALDVDAIDVDAKVNTDLHYKASVEDRGP
jgi:hypothetical protein